MTTLYEIKEVSGLYADAALGNEQNELRFLSVWGLDTAIQEFLGRLSLPVHRGGLNELTLKSKGQWYGVGNPHALKKHTGRSFSKHSLFQGLVHLWVYHPSVRQIDYANRQFLLLKLPTESEAMFSQRLWGAVKTVCPVPLLDTWKSMLDDFKAENCIQHYEGICIDGYRLNFSAENLVQMISLWIKQGKFTLPKKDQREP